MSKYYEQIKSNYTRDVDHLSTSMEMGFGLKKNWNNKHRFITSKKIDKVTI